MTSVVVIVTAVGARFHRLTPYLWLLINKIILQRRWGGREREWVRNKQKYLARSGYIKKVRFELEIVVPFSLYHLLSLLPQLFPAHIISNAILVLQTQFSLPFIINICKARIKMQMLIVIIQVKWIMEASCVIFFLNRYPSFVY